MVEVLEEVRVRLVDQVERGVARTVEGQVGVLQAELADEVGRQVLDFHGVGAREEVACGAVAV